MTEQTEYLKKLNKAAKLLRLIHLRCDLINYVIVNGTETVTELQIRFRNNHHCSMSEQLNELKKYGIVECVRDSKNIIYSVVGSKIESINNALNIFSKN